MSQTPPALPSKPPPPPVGGAKVVIAALAMAFLAVIILSIYLESERKKIARDQITVYILQRQVRPGDRLNPKDWKPVEMPRAFGDSFESLKAVIGSEESLLAMVKRGQQFEVQAPEGALLTHTLFDKPFELRDLEVERGKVRLALPVKSRLTPGGLRPGMPVDIAAPMLTGGQVPETMIVMQNVTIKAVGTYTLAEEQGGAGRIVRSYNTVSIDVYQDVAVKLSTLEKMVKVTGEFEIYIAPFGDRIPDWDPGQINPKVLGLINKNLPAAQ